MIEIKHESNQQRYVALVCGMPAGFCQYEASGGTVTFTHTVVDPEFEGQGIGSALGKFALEDCQATGKKVVPACAFISRYMAMHNEFKGLLR